MIVLILFALFDDDESGFLTHEEFHQGLKSQNLLHLDCGGEKFKELLNEVDTNNDGKLSLDEFSLLIR